MAHTLKVDYKDEEAFTNDPHFHLDEEFGVFEILNQFWEENRTQGKRPQFFLTEKIITHDISVSPAIIVSNSDDATQGMGVTYPAKSAVKTLAINITSLDRGLLFDTRNEVVRILDYCRKYPIAHWDFTSKLDVRRLDPRPGNNHAFVYLRLRKLVEYIPAVIFPVEERPGLSLTTVEITSPTPSMHVGAIITINAEADSSQDILGMEAFIDNIQIGETIVGNVATWEYPSINLTNTAHQLIVTASTVDQKGTAGLLFVVDN
jgi:hypothetical protein